MDKHVSRRNLISGVVGTAVGLTALGKLSEPAFADQPHMQAALAALNTAQHELSVAEQDKAGHRAKALDFVNRAINQVNMGIQAGR